MASALAAKASELGQLTRDELTKKAISMASMYNRLKQKGKAPLRQAAGTLAGFTGGAVSGVTHYYLPEVLGVPVDGAVGLLIALGSLSGAGDSLADAAAVFGVGLASPAVSRGVENGLRTLAAKSPKK